MGRKILIIAVFTGLTYATTASAYEIRRAVTDQIDKVRLITRLL